MEVYQTQRREEGREMSIDIWLGIALLAFIAIAEIQITANYHELNANYHDLKSWITDSVKPLREQNAHSRDEIGEVYRKLFDAEDKISDLEKRLDYEIKDSRDQFQYMDDELEYQKQINKDVDQHIKQLIKEQHRTANKATVSDKKKRR